MKSSAEEILLQLELGAVGSATVWCCAVMPVLSRAVHLTQRRCNKQGRVSPAALCGRAALASQIVFLPVDTATLSLQRVALD